MTRTQRRNQPALIVQGLWDRQSISTERESHDRYCFVSTDHSILPIPVNQAGARRGLCGRSARPERHGLQGKSLGQIFFVGLGAYATAYGVNAGWNIILVFHPAHHRAGGIDHRATAARLGVAIAMVTVACPSWACH